MARRFVSTHDTPGPLPVATALLVAATCGAVAAEGPLVVGEAAPIEIETPHPYPEGDPSGPVVWRQALRHPGATYLTFHVERIELAPGDHLAVLDHTGKEQGRLTGLGPAGGGRAWTPAVDGEVAVLELRAFGNGAPEQRFGLVIDRYAHGFLPLEDPDADGSTDIVCGSDQRKDAKCYETSHPVEYDKGRAVGRLLINGVVFCTGWLASCEGHMISNNHCLSTQASVENTQIRMMYERSGCGSGTNSFDRTINGKDLVRTSGPLDYTLFTVVEDVSEYGFLGMDPRLPAHGERIYLPAHHNGAVKRFGIESDAEPEGVCRVAEAPWTLGTNDILYFCDTSGGSSGGPVLSGVTDRVVALNHTETNNCFSGNQGVRIDLVFNEIQGDLPACSFSPDLRLDAVEILDASGNGNGFADPGETLQLRVTLGNAGTVPATAVTGTLSTPEPGVLVNDADASFPDVPDAGSAASLAPHFEIRLSRTLACGTRIPFHLDLAAAEGPSSFDFEVAVGQNLGGARFYVSSDVPKAIPDSDPVGITSTLDVPDSFLIVDAFAQPDISHTYAGDLIVELASPGATTVRLHDQTGWGRDDLDDDYDREVAPDGPGAMSDFDGEQAFGTWTLSVADPNFFDTGSLDGWTIELHEADDFVCTPVGGDPSPGEASAAASTMLVTGYDEGTGDVSVSYDPSCQASDHVAYSGALAGVATLDWDAAACGLGTSGSATFDPGAGSRYFVLVGQAGPEEGSYGSDHLGVERPEASGVGGCDLPQNLFDSCP